MLYEISKKKMKYIKYGAIFICLCIILKLFYIQIVSYYTLSEKATTLWQRSFPIEATRGEILDRNGDTIVTNLTTSSLVVIPSQIKDPISAASALAPILQCDEATLLAKLSKKVSIQRISPEGRQLSEDQSLEIDNLKIPGVYLIKDTKRYYLNGNYLAQTLGFVGIDNQGLAGLELKYNDYLSGKNGSIEYYMDAKGNNLPIYSSDYVYPTNGMDIELTIDKRLQDIVERELNNAYDTYNPDGIWALMMNPKTGEILSICSKPDFDPNHYQDYDSSTYNQNIPVWKTYEPGSTFKIITFASALNEKLFDMDKDTYYDKGYEIVGGARIKSWKAGGHGLQTFREVLQNSSNPGFVEIGRRLGKDKLYQYVQDFGLTKKTGVDLVGESSGIMFNYDKFGPLEQATVSFGQGISITPIQLVTAVSACVNGGHLNQPYILNKVINPYTKEAIYEATTTHVRDVISEETSALVRDALEGVVANGGGKNAYIEGYRIGGKTGTAQKAVDGSYVGGGYILSFLGVAPVDDPEVVLYIAMDNAKNCVQYGGTTVAPIARKILVDVLNVLGVEKVTEQKEKTYTWMDIPKYTVDQYIGLSKSEVKSDHFKFKYVGEGDTVIDQLPRVNEKQEDGSTIIIMLGDSDS